MAAEKIIRTNDGGINVLDNPIIPFIKGDGIGSDIWAATRNVLDAAVEKCYGGARKIEWLEILAGEKAKEKTGEWLPQATMDSIIAHVVAIKGPLVTPVGGGRRSLNVTLRQELDLYACVRPVRYYQGVVTPVKAPEKVDMVIFRENTEDVYAGIEYQSGSEEAAKLIDFIKGLGGNIRPDSGVGVKPMSPFGSKRLVRKAINYAIEHGRSSVTLVHKGNIMKFTEGAFRNWGYELVKEEFADRCITEEELWDKYDGRRPEDKILINDRTADAMFQQVLLRPHNFSVLALPNLNGDYISDALAAQVGGLGMAPGANIGDGYAMFEATHGTAPDVGKDEANPGSLLLSGCMLLEYLSWDEATDMIQNALEKTINTGIVTADLANQIQGSIQVRCSEFGREIISNL